MLTLAPDLTWAHFGSDGPELITAAVTLGVPHPPGYPTYVLLGHLFARLPLGTIAYRFNLFSALSLATAAGFVAAAGGHWSRSEPLRPEAKDGEGAQRRATLGQVATGLTFAFVPLVWSQALIAEVYGLNLAFLAALLWALLSRRPAWLSGLLWGLSLTTHLTSLLLLPLLVYLVPRRRWGQMALGLLLGLTPLLALPLLARGDSPVVWGSPQQWSGWWWLVSGRLYQPNLLSLPPAQLPERLLAWSRAFLDNFAWFGVPLLLWALVDADRRQRRRALLFLGVALLYALYALAYRSDDAAVFSLPAFLLLSILLAGILQKLGWLALLLPLALLMLNFSKVSLHSDQEVRALAETTLQEAPPAAILLTTGDRTTFTLWYLHYVEGQRPDIVIVDSDLFAFDWYRQRLSRQQPELRHMAGDDLNGFRTENEQERPFCDVQFPLTGTGSIPSGKRIEIGSSCS